MTYNALKTLLYTAGMDKHLAHKLAFEKYGTEFSANEKFEKLNTEKTFKTRILGEK